MFLDDTNPLQVGQSIAFSTDPLNPVTPLQFNNVPDGGIPFVSGRRSNGDPFVLVLSPTGITAQGGGSGSGSGGTPSAPSPTCFLGVVTGGTGSTYTMTISNNGVAENITATHPQIDASETIPVGTYALVVKDVSTYYLVVPVWL